MKEIIIEVPDNFVCTNDEVIRCRNCKWWRQDSIQHNVNDGGEWDDAYCERLCDIDRWGDIFDVYKRTPSDFYCAAAERISK